MKVLKAHVTRYIKPERHYYSSEKEFRQAIKLNGEGKETIFGTAPRENFTIAANLKRFKRGTILRIKGSDIDLICKIDDRCAAAEKIWKKKRIVQFDIFSKMTPTQALEWGKQNLTVEILQEKL